MENGGQTIFYLNYTSISVMKMPISLSSKIGGQTIEIRQKYMLV